MIAGARIALSILLSLALASAGSGQTLAHKGWAGAGVTVERWWQHAVLYELDPLRVHASDGPGASASEGITDQLDYLQTLSVDALVLSSERLQVRNPVALQALAQEGNFDLWIGEAGRRKMRVVVDLPLSADTPLAATLNLARFWLSRGVAGFRLVPEVASAPPSDPGAWIRELRRVMASYPGQRVLISGWSSSPPARRQATDLAIVQAFPGSAEPEWTAESVKAVLRDSASTKAPQPLFSLVEKGDTSLGAAHARLVATVLLLTPAGALLHSGQETMSESGGRAKESVLDWYREMTLLHHTNAALRSGTMHVLSTGNPNVVAWVGAAPSPLATPVLVALNLSDRPVNAALGAELARIGAGTGSLRVLARFGDELPVTHTEVELGAYGIVVCELPRADRPEKAKPAPSRSITALRY